MEKEMTTEEAKIASHKLVKHLRVWEKAEKVLDIVQNLEAMISGLKAEKGGLESDLKALNDSIEKAWVDEKAAISKKENVVEEARKAIEAESAMERKKSRQEFEEAQREAKAKMGDLMGEISGLEVTLKQARQKHDADMGAMEKERNEMTAKVEMVKAEWSRIREKMGV